MRVQEFVLLLQLGFNIQPGSCTDSSTDDSSENEEFSVRCLERSDVADSDVRHCQCRDQFSQNDTVLILKHYLMLEMDFSFLNNCEDRHV